MKVTKLLLALAMIVAAPASMAEVNCYAKDDSSRNVRPDAVKKTVDHVLAKQRPGRTENIRPRKPGDANN